MFNLQLSRSCRLQLVCATIAVSAATPAIAMNADVMDFGASDNSYTKDSTLAFQKAIDFSARTGGGTVTVPNGVFRISRIEMKSDITLSLADGARILGFQDYTKYVGSNTGFFDPRKAMITGIKLNNVAIVGTGIIDGNNSFVPEWVNGPAPSHIDSYRRGAHLIRLEECINVTIGTGNETKKLRLRRSGNYTLFMNSCSDVLIENVHIEGGTDGLHARYTSDFTVRNFTVLNNMDDGVAAHSTRNWTMDNVSITGGYEQTRLDISDGINQQTRDNLKIGVGRGNGIRFGGTNWKATNVTIKNKALAAIGHFSSTGVTASESELESDNWRLKDWTIDRCARVLDYNYGALWQEQRPLGFAELWFFKATDLKGGMIVQKGKSAKTVNLRVRDSSFSVNSNRWKSDTDTSGEDYKHISYGMWVSGAKSIGLFNCKFEKISGPRRTPLIFSDVDSLTKTGVTTNPS